jgi:mannose-1-phosphate guanylyltransferase
MYGVIMAGGRGVRFWPMSRGKRPKHLLDILGAKTLIQETVHRILPIIPPERILIVTAAAHAEELMRQLPEIPPANVLVEPVGRNTAPCIGLAALALMKKDPDAVMALLPADHRIDHDDLLRRMLSAAEAVAADGSTLVTIGIPPTFPSTGYGYLEQGDPKTSPAAMAVYHVRSIREKPDYEQARAFLSTGRFLWNSGMFIWKASTILAAMARWLPDIHGGLMDIDRAMGTPEATGVTERVYRGMRAISIDYGVMEKAENVVVIPGDLGWSDVGSWDTIWELASKDGQGNAARDPEWLVAVDAQDNLLQVQGKLVALVGVRDLLVVETEDALLICRRGISQDIRKIVDILEHKKMNGYL